MKRREVRRAIRQLVFSGAARPKIWQRDRITGCAIATNSSDMCTCLSGLLSADEIIALQDSWFDGFGYAIYNPNDAKEGLPFDAEFGKKLARKRAIDDIVRQIMERLPPETESKEDRCEAEYAELGRLLTEAQERAARRYLAFVDLSLGRHMRAEVKDTRRFPRIVWQQVNGGSMETSRGGRSLAEELREFLERTE